MGDRIKSGVNGTFVVTSITPVKGTVRMTSGSSSSPDKLRITGVDDDGNVRSNVFSTGLPQVRRVGTGESATAPDRPVERTRPGDVQPGDRIMTERGDATVLRVLGGEGNSGRSTALFVQYPGDASATKLQYQDQHYVDVTGHDLPYDRDEAAVIDDALAAYQADRSNTYIDDAVRDARARAADRPSDPVDTPEAPEEAVSGPEERLAVPGTDVQLTTRSSEWFRTLVGEMQMWDGAGLITSDMAGLGNLTDLKVKGLIVTEESDGGRGKVAFARLTPLGVQLAESIGLDVPEYSIVGNDRPSVEPTDEEIEAKRAARSKPPYTGDSYWLSAFDERAKVASRKRYIPALGDDQLWVAKWKIDKRLEYPQHYNAKDLKRLEEISRDLDTEIKFRLLSDPSLRPLPDGRVVDPEDHKKLISSAKGLPLEGDILTTAAVRNDVKLPDPPSADPFSGPGAIGLTDVRPVEGFDDVFEATVAPNSPPVWRNVGVRAELDGPAVSSWDGWNAAQGGFTNRVMEGDTQFAGTRQQALEWEHPLRRVDNGEHYLVQADISGLPVRFIRSHQRDTRDPDSGSNLKENGDGTATLLPDTGLGVGVVGDVPVDRILSIDTIFQDGTTKPKAANWGEFAAKKRRASPQLVRGDYDDADPAALDDQGLDSQISKFSRFHGRTAEEQARLDVLQAEKDRRSAPAEKLPGEQTTDSGRPWFKVEDIAVMRDEDLVKLRDGDRYKDRDRELAATVIEGRANKAARAETDRITYEKRRADYAAANAAPVPAPEPFDYDAAIKRRKQRRIAALARLRDDLFGSDAEFAADILSSSSSDVIDRYVAGDRTLTGDDYRELAHEFEAAGSMAEAAPDYDADKYEALALNAYNLAGGADDSARRAAEAPVPGVTPGFGSRTTPVMANALRVGDKLDDRTRVTKVFTRDGGRVTVQTKVQGSTSPSVREYEPGEYVPVYERGADPSDFGDVNERGSKAYKAAYARGYKSSERFGGSDNLGRADERGEPDAWYDGYHDHAAGRPKWTSMKFDAETRERMDRGELDADGNEVNEFDRADTERAAAVKAMGFEAHADDPVVKQRVTDLYDSLSSARQPEWFPGEEFNPGSTAESSIENAWDLAVEKGFATRATPDARTNTGFNPVPPLTDGELEQWVDENAASSFMGILDSYGFEYRDGQLQVRSDLASEHPDLAPADVDPEAAATRFNRLGVSWEAFVDPETGELAFHDASGDTMPVRKNPNDDSWEMQRGGSWKPVAGNWTGRGAAAALRGSDTPSYDGDLDTLRLELSLADPVRRETLVSDYRQGFESWTLGRQAEFLDDFKIPRKPYSSGNGVRDRDAMWKAMTQWHKDIREAVETGRPLGSVDAQATVDSSDAEIEAELARLGRIAEEANRDSEAVTDKAGRGGSLTALDQYLTQRSEFRTKAVSNAAEPLRTEIMNRLAQQIGTGTDSGYDSDRWDGVSDVTARIDAYGGRSDEMQKTRDTYVVQDANTVSKNASVRSGNPTPAAKAWKTRVNKWVNTSHATADSRVYRGSALSADFIRRMQLGGVIIDSGIMSTDRDESAADFYLKTRLRSRPDSIPVMFEILVPAGHPIVDADYGEHVLGSDEQMIVRKVVLVDGTYRVTVELG